MTTRSVKQTGQRSRPTPSYGNQKTRGRTRPSGPKNTREPHPRILYASCEEFVNRFVTLPVSEASRRLIARRVLLSAIAGNFTEEFRSALLDLGSETPDNTLALKYVNRSKEGWRVGDHSIADILHQLEDSAKELRKLMRGRKPKIMEIEAALRVAVLVFTAAGEA